MDNNTNANANEQNNNQNNPNTEQGTQQNGTGTNETLTNEQLFDRLDSILDTRLDRLTKSILKDNGVEESEISEIVSQYKANKAQKQKATADSVNTLKTENESLKKTILNHKLDSVAAKVGEEIGINPKYLKQALKLADLKDTLKDNSVDEEALKTALNAVLEDCEVFKKNDEGTGDNGFKNIGAKQSTEKVGDGTEKWRAAFGLSTK